MAVNRPSSCIVHPVVPHRIIAGSFGMAAFCVSIISGLCVDNSATAILVRSMAALVLCYFVGTVVGWVCEYVVRDHLGRYKAEHPVPHSIDDLLREGGEKGGDPASSR